MIEKGLLSGLWVHPECRSLAVIFTLDHVSPSCFTVLSFLTTLVATRRRRCLLRSAWVNIMPVRLLFVISGILAGGIPGFRMELLLLLSPDVAHRCVFVLFCFVFYFGPFLGWHIRCHRAWNSNCWSQSFHCLLWLVSVLVVWFGSLLFCSFLVCVVFDGIAHWTLYWSTTSSFEAADLIDGLASNYNSACLLRLNVCNDLAKAMKALDGKKNAVFSYAQTPNKFRILFFPSNAFMASARSLTMFWCMLQVGMNWLIKSCVGRQWWNGLKSKLVENRYVVLCTVTFITARKAKQTNKRTNSEYASNQTVYNGRNTSSGKALACWFFICTNLKQTVFKPQVYGAGPCHQVQQDLKESSINFFFCARQL